MGSQTFERYRHPFPVTESLIYLNHAAVAPLCKPAADAMRRLADDALAFGSLHYSQWMACYEGLRQAAARPVGASPRAIAIVKNTSEGLAAGSTGIAWKPDRRIERVAEEL